MNLPDITKTENAPTNALLHRVGMSKVQLPVRTKNGLQAAECDLLVSLDDATKKGIHMSRLYLIAAEELAEKPLSLGLLKQVAEQFIDSQNGIAKSAEIAVRTTHMRKVKSLKSDNLGWRYYPLELRVMHENGVATAFAHITLTYSSTCPCSAALSRAAAVDTFETNFTGKTPSVADVTKWLKSPAGMPATPHSQRSYALVEMEIKDGELDLEAVINSLENALQTSVQAVVKRQDEQAFALRNGGNLMFSEDAARRLKTALDSIKSVVDYTAEVRHEESLHPHDAIAIVTKEN